MEYGDDRFAAEVNFAMDEVWGLAAEMEKQDAALVKIGEAFEKAGVGIEANTLALFGKNSVIRGICLSMSGYGDSHELSIYSEDTDGDLWKMGIASISEDELTDAHREHNINYGCYEHKKVPKKSVRGLLEIFDRNKELTMIRNSYGIPTPQINYIKRVIVKNEHYEIVEVVVLDMVTFKERTVLASLGHVYIDKRDTKGILSYIESVEDFIKRELDFQREVLHMEEKSVDAYDIEQVKKAEERISILMDDAFVQLLSASRE